MGLMKRDRIVSRPEYKIAYKKLIGGRSRDQKTLVRNYIREWREFRGFKSQMSLAKAAKLSPNTVHRLESFTLAYTPYTLEALARVLNCHPGLLTCMDPNRVPDYVQQWLNQDFGMEQVPQKRKQRSNGSEPRAKVVRTP